MNRPKFLKSKRLLSVLSFVGVIVVLVLVICMGEINNNRYNKTDKDNSSEPMLYDPYNPSNGSQIPTINVGANGGITYDPIELGKNVTVTINPAIKDAPIDRSPDVDPSHPEYIESYIGGGSFSGREGKVYKNDRVWMIDIQNNSTGEWITFSFGHALGEYNRFLYLNPAVVSSDPDRNGYFRFKASNGTLLDLSKTYENKKEMFAKNDNFTIRRAMDQLSVAEYSDPMYPGAAWYTPGELSSPVYVDTICYYGQGPIAAILRLWIDKDEDGCYYIASIENQDLYLQNNPVFDTAELYYIYEKADTDLLDTDLTGLRVSDKDWGVEDYFFDLREAGTGPYYDYFLLTGKASADESKFYKDYDIMAVTLRYNGVAHSITLYYQIIARPFAGNHGVYRYLGRDYHYNSSIATLRGSGYPGYD